MTIHTVEKMVINPCPKGTAPYFMYRKIGAFRRQTVLKCNCECLRVAEAYMDSVPGEKRAYHDVVTRWNEQTTPKGYS